MPWINLQRRTCLNLIGALILLIGLSSDGLVYHRAENPADDILGYEESDGTPYPLSPEDSKDYLRNVELYGGKANVLADKLRRSFLSLWQGKPPAIIIGSVGIVVSLGFFYAANASLEHVKPGEHSKDNESKSND
jgi:hypothetical protein